MRGLTMGPEVGCFFLAECRLLKRADARHERGPGSAGLFTVGRTVYGGSFALFYFFSNAEYFDSVLFPGYQRISWRGDWSIAAWHPMHEHIFWERIHSLERLGVVYVL